jgi:hypothetical protein
MTDPMLPSDPSPTPEGAPEGGARRSGGSGGFGKSLTFSVGRGLLLIAVAIIIGVVLLQLVDDGSTNSKNTSATSTTATTAAKASTTTTTANNTGTTGGLTPTNQLSVVVLNGTGITGTAASVSSKLGAAPLSYKMLTAGNTTKVTGNTVYYTGNLSGEAAAMATAVNAATQGVTGVSNETKVAPMPNPIPKDWQSTDVSKAQLVVIVGAK